MLIAPGQPADLVGRLYERDRWEWRTSDGGDPFQQLAAFLNDAGIAVVTGAARADSGGGVVGATILIGGAVLPADLSGEPLAAASPCPVVPDVAAVVYGRAPYRRRARCGSCSLGDWTPSWHRDEHAAAVDQVRAAIERGDVYQANVVGHRWAPFSGEPGALGTVLSSVPDAPYAGGMAGDGWAVVSASPELFLEVAAEGVVRTRPIKGTVPRGTTPGADRAARTALRRSAKDRAEHVMIVDLERNDLGRVAVTGSVRVDELYAVRPLAGVWHAESTVSARLLPEVGLAELLSVTFPGGSVTGAPKRAALQLLAGLEPVGRGPAMGAMGWIAADGSLRLGLTIRTVAVAEGRAHLWVGGGVTWSSVAADEVAEADAKAAPLLAAMALPSVSRGSAS